MEDNVVCYSYDGRNTTRLCVCIRQYTRTIRRKGGRYNDCRALACTELITSATCDGVLFSLLFVCLFVSRIKQKVMSGFSRNLGSGKNIDYGSEMSYFSKWSGSTYCGHFIVFIDSSVVDRCEKWKWRWEKQWQRSAGQLRPMCLLFAGNDTVPVSVWRGGGMRCAECRLVTCFIRHATTEGCCVVDPVR